MKNLKKQFLEIRKSVPKQTQWIMLIAVFVILLILLTLLINKKSNKTKVPDINPESPILNISPKTELDLTNIQIGDTKKNEFTISANKDVKVISVKFESEIEGLSKKTTCENIGKINEKINCNINIEFSPKNTLDTKITAVLIDWRGAFEPEKMNKTDRINITISSKEKTDNENNIEKETEKNNSELKKDNENLNIEKSITKNEENENNKNDDLSKDTKEINIEKEEDKSLISKDIKEEIKKDIEDISKDPLKIEEEIESSKEEKSENEKESCSEFSFPGYNISGDQIGWIKPDKGSYKFYPFSDKTCTSPTGIYNPDNGIITDIKDSSKKIGTDADHIGSATNITVSNIPNLSKGIDARPVNKAKQLDEETVKTFNYSKHKKLAEKNEGEFNKYQPSSLLEKKSTISSKPYDRTFVLRQYKPIPATIVTEIKAVKDGSKLPVTATVDRNVYSDNGRTIILPTGTLMLGYVSDKELPGPYKSIGRMNLAWYRFVRPDGVEFNFMEEKTRPFAGDAQGRSGVPGHGSTDYIEQFFMPMLTAIVPAAVNMIAPISDKVVNQINLDSNVVTKTEQVRSSELAKNEIVKSWNQIAQKLLTDSINNTVPPFSIAAGTRITVYSPTDLIVTCDEEDTGKKCAITKPDESYAEPPEDMKYDIGGGDYASSLVGQVRSFNLNDYCNENNEPKGDYAKKGYDYRTILFYCQSRQYKAINNAKQDAIFENQKKHAITDTKEYNEKTLGLEYEGDKIKNPFEEKKEEAPAGLKCEDGTSPDSNGCCTGEKYTDMGEQGFNCCPESGGDCFPPMK